MRNKKIIKNTDHSRVYNMAIRLNFGCPICGPNRGCNRNRNNDFRNWKRYRGNQWKD